MLLDTPVCDFGWQAPAFTLADAAGASFSFDDVMGEHGVLVAFICNHCPYVIAVIDRLVADAGLLQNEGVGVVAIMPNDYHAYPADAPDAMKAFAAAHNFSFPYLIDEDQSIARAYDAVCTPDFFGFDKTGGLQYRGRIDDAKMGDANHRVPELLNAMRQVATTGHGPKAQTPSMGCSIKWKQS